MTPRPTKPLQDQSALVTGGASGIGRATAIAFASQGAKVLVSDLDDDRGEETANMIRGQEGQAAFIQADVADEAEVERLVASAVHEYGRLDHAFNNAGIDGEPGYLHETNEDTWTRVIQVNLEGVWHCMRNEIPLMLKNGGGSIVNCASVAGMRGVQGMSAYTASKHGVVGLTRSAALEYAGQGIRVNAVCPGAIETPMIARYTKGDPEKEKTLVQSAPIGRLGRPEEVAACVLWLCQKDSGFVTGTTIPVDGGWTAR